MGIAFFFPSVIPSGLYSTRSSILLPRHLTVSLLLSHKDIDLSFFHKKSVVGNLNFNSSNQGAVFMCTNVFVVLYPHFHIFNYHNYGHPTQLVY